MSAPVDTWAPGKMMWLGEYAVLDGAPAVVAAVDRGARATFAADRGDGLWLDPLGAAPVMRLHDGAGVALPDGVPPGGELAAAVVNALVDAGVPLPGAVGTLRVDTSELRADAKLGLGSSAAACVALVRALAPGARDEVVAGAAHAAHHAFQGKVGSGADVIAAVFGGVSIVRDGVRERAVLVPRSLSWAAIACDEAADTRAMVRALGSWRERDGDRAGLLLGALAHAAARGADALAEGNVRGWLSSVEHFGMAERRITEASGVPIVSPSVARAMDAAHAAGWVAKPSGAGGGDVVIAFAERGDDAALDAALRAVGMTRLRVGLG